MSSVAPQTGRANIKLHHFARDVLLDLLRFVTKPVHDAADERLLTAIRLLTIPTDEQSAALGTQPRRRPVLHDRPVRTQPKPVRTTRLTSRTAATAAADNCEETIGEDDDDEEEEDEEEKLENDNEKEEENKKYNEDVKLVRSKNQRSVRDRVDRLPPASPKIASSKTTLTRRGSATSAVSRAADAAAAGRAHRMPENARPRKADTRTINHVTRVKYANSDRVAGSCCSNSSILNSRPEDDWLMCAIDSVLESEHRMACINPEIDEDSLIELIDAELRDPTTYDRRQDIHVQKYIGGLHSFVKNIDYFLDKSFAAG